MQAITAATAQRRTERRDNSKLTDESTDYSGRLLQPLQFAAGRSRRV